MCCDYSKYACTRSRLAGGAVCTRPGHEHRQAPRCARLSVRVSLQLVLKCVLDGRATDTQGVLRTCRRHDGYTRCRRGRGPARCQRGSGRARRIHWTRTDADGRRRSQRAPLLACTNTTRHTCLDRLRRSSPQVASQRQQQRSRTCRWRYLRSTSTASFAPPSWASRSVCSPLWASSYSSSSARAASAAARRAAAASARARRRTAAASAG